MYSLGGFMINSLKFEGSYIPKVEVPRNRLKDVLLGTCINGVTSCVNSPPMSSFANQVCFFF